MALESGTGGITEHLGEHSDEEKGEKPVGSDGRTSGACRREAALREADCWEESAESNILTKSTVQWRTCELLAFCFVFVFSRRIPAPR